MYLLCIVKCLFGDFHTDVGCADDVYAAFESFECIGERCTLTEHDAGEAVDFDRSVAADGFVCQSYRFKTSFNTAEIAQPEVVEEECSLEVFGNIAGGLYFKFAVFYDDIFTIRRL